MLEPAEVRLSMPKASAGLGFTISRGGVMDISFAAGEKKFNYRVAAVILNGGKLLAMRDEYSPYYYLPGGRVKLGETASSGRYKRSCTSPLRSCALSG